MRGVTKATSCHLLALVALGVSATSAAQGRQEEIVETDLLIVGGTESACAAAVQAARMGVKRIAIVNDIEWLGGQFTAEALMAIDENTYKTGVRHDQPIPRHGAFKEIVERIEADNLKKYGVARPGNTRVVTTCRPADAERVFREWLSPYVEKGQLGIHSWYEPVRVVVSQGRVAEVAFKSRRGGGSLRVRARLTIDASDWGDVIRLSGAAYEFGPDLKMKYGEPLAPARREGYPLTDMNPITYCMVIEETDRLTPIPKPPGYDPRNYRQHGYPKDPLWLYGTRRLVDHYHFPQIKHPDVLLLCFPAFDYPLDVLPKSVADRLESAESGASEKNIVELTPPQRRIIFSDAKQYSLGFLYYLQTEAHDAMPDKTHSFRRFRLTDEFGTPDKLPFKPYVRESLRLKAMYMMRQQDTTGVGGDSANYARIMYHDGVAVWQFEYDFHPTRREFLSDGDPSGPWRNAFRDGRTWGPPFSGRSLFALRSMIPERLDGLLGCQKNLGYSSIVSSAVRLHDQSMAVGQAVGACAGVSLNAAVQPREIPFDRERLLAVQQAIAVRHEDGAQPGMLWPFKDLQPTHAAFSAVNLLAAQGCLPLNADDVNFQADEPATADWIAEVIGRTRSQMAPGWKPTEPTMESPTRGGFARRWWAIVQSGPWKAYVRKSTSDADEDGVADRDDALPLDAENGSLPIAPIPPHADGLPDKLPAGSVLVKQFNCAGRGAPAVPGFVTDYGEKFTAARGYGWSRDVSEHHRRRGKAQVLPDTYQLTRSHD
ncbi:MAG: FAD-dependent oxidoreductase, partial [Pirellulaceae bacterium]|nr:FAD-dependent oxidoreductase [Pirellulaceae bacterium]